MLPSAHLGKIQSAHLRSIHPALTAVVATLIQSAKLNGVDPLAWLSDVLERIVSRRTRQDELHTLLPWNWGAAGSVEARNTG